MDESKNSVEETYIKFLAEELEKEKLIIFVGAGVSKNSGLPDWNKLIREYARELGNEKEYFDSDEMLEIPQEYFDKFGSPKYYEILDKIFSKSYEPNSIHEILGKTRNIKYVKK